MIQLREGERKKENVEQGSPRRCAIGNPVEAAREMPGAIQVRM